MAIPGLVIGVAYLWAWIGIPGGLYGTIWILALAFIARFMPDTVKALSTSFLQIHRELEEAAWVCGKGMLGRIRTIVLPLARPGVFAAMTLLFVLAIRELGSSLFLYTSNTMVMSVRSDQAPIRQDDRTGVRSVRRHHLDPHHVRASGARRGLLGEAG
ncbi:ABC transporter permease, partial [Bradyrhizobium sp.]|uniref:ABC transporter permease n=1 Tax=Bradyrhizobium sp. TaxID=376 RepID=UPI003C7970A7